MQQPASPGGSNSSSSFLMGDIDYRELQQYRKVHAVVGIMSCRHHQLMGDDRSDPSALRTVSSLRYGFEQYGSWRTSGPYAQDHVPIGRCFAVEHEEDDMSSLELEKSVVSDQSSAATTNSALRRRLSDELVVIPNQEGKIDFYVETLVIDMVAELLQHLEECAQNPVQYLVGHHSLDMYKASNDPHLSKRRQIRLNKVFADYCLLAGDYQDAQEQYRATIEMCKTIPGSGEELEQGTCWEGLAAAQLFEAFLIPAYGNSNDTSPTSSSASISSMDVFPPVVSAIGDGTASVGTFALDDQIDVIVQHCTEAIQCYERANQRKLMVEMLLKMALFCATRGGKRRRVFAVDCTSRIAVEIGSGDWRAEDRAVLYCAMARIASIVQYHRKCGHFLRLAAQAFWECRNHAVARRLASLCFDSYGIPITQ